MISSVQIRCEADHGEKAWVARITGRDPKKLYKRDFLGVSPHVTKPGVYEATERKDGRAYYAVVHTASDDLCRIKIGAATLAELLDGWLGRMDEIVGDPNAEPRNRLRDETGNFRVHPKTNIAALAAERERLVARLAEIDALLADKTESRFEAEKV